MTVKRQGGWATSDTIRAVPCQCIEGQSRANALRGHKDRVTICIEGQSRANARRHYDISDA